MKNRKFEIGDIKMDDMVVSLIENCYGVDYADILSHFYQLTLQALQSEPNIIGPLKPPTGETRYCRNGKSYKLTKKVETPQEVDYSIWVIRGFYPETSIPFKMVVWYSDKEWGEFSGSTVSMGTFPDRTKWIHLPCKAVREYVEEVAEKTILDQPVDESKKPRRFSKQRNYKCMSPKGVPLQKKKVTK